MPLSQFPTAMPAAVAAVIHVATVLRYIRDTSGDLTFNALNDVQNALRISKATTYAALQEGAKSPAASESFMASIGGPETLADFQAAAFDLEAKASAWNSLVAATLSTLPVDKVIGMVTVSTNGIETRHIEYKTFIPADLAAPIRTSQQLADLISAFEAVGA